MSNAIMAFDLATCTGWAYAEHNELHTGVINVSGYKTHGARFKEFYFWTDAMIRSVKPQHIFFEDASDAARRTSKAQSQLWFGWRANLFHIAHDALYIEPQPVSTSAYKKAFGVPFRCGKNAVIEECNRRGFAVTDENIADAIAILNYGLSDYGCSLADFKEAA